MPPPPPTPAPGVPVVRLLPRRPCAPPESSPPRSATAGDKKRRPPERLEVPLSSSWPSATLKKSPRPGPGPSTSQPPTSVRATPQTSPAHSGIPAAATCTAPPRTRCCHSSAGIAATGISVGAGAGPDDAMRFSLSLTPEAILVIQRRHLEKQLLARPRRSIPSPSPEARRPLVPSPRARASGLRRGGTSSVPDAPPAAGLRRSPRASLLPGGLQPTVPGPRLTDLRPVVKVSLLNEQHKYDDVEYEEETDVVDEGLVRKCTEWLRGVESAAATRGRTHHLDSLPHLSTL